MTSIRPDIDLWRYQRQPIAAPGGARRRSAARGELRRSRQEQRLQPSRPQWPGRRCMAWLVLALLPLQAWCAAPDVDRLLQQLARPAPSSTPFVEVHFSRLLARPLIVSGTLEYLGPDSLARQVEQPYQERTQIKGDAVTVLRANEPARKFSLQHAPDLKSLLSSFTSLLSGNRKALEQQFSLSVGGDEQHWSMQLTPIDRRVRERISGIEVAGAGGEPRCITTTEPNDTVTVMLLTGAARAPLPNNPDLVALQALCRADK